MKWIVFVLGLVLVAGGFAAMWQGYGIVEVERGWTLVISGTVAFSAGVVTIALGILVDRIDALRVSMAAKLAESPRESVTDDREWNDPLPETAAVGSMTPSVPVTVAEVAIEEAMASVVAESMTSLPEEPAPPTVPADPETDLPPPEQPLESPPVRAEPDTARRLDFRSRRPSPFGKVDLATPIERVDIAPPKARRPTFMAPPPMSSKSLPRRGAWPSAPSPAATEPEPTELAVPQPAHEPPPAAPVAVEDKKGQYDWLERALARGESKTESSTPRAVGETETTMSAPAIEHEAPAAPVAADARTNGADFDRADHANVEAAPPQPSEPELVGLSEPIALAAAEPETPAESAANDASGAPAAAAIIGRYESNGASYVLYADGTIDATTQSGVFHFASMAELKVFIENKT